MSKLKPCPFCGGEAELLCAPSCFKSGLSSTGWLVKCKNGCCNQMPYGSDHDAIEAWNRRTTIEPERKKGKWIEISKFDHSYKCSICGRTLINITDGKNTVTKNYPFCHCGADMRGDQDENN